MYICKCTVCAYVVSSGCHLHVQYMYLYVKREFFIHVCTCKWVLIPYSGYFWGGLNFRGTNKICTHEIVPHSTGGGGGGLEYCDHKNYATNLPKLHCSRKVFPQKYPLYSNTFVLLSFYVIYSTCTCIYTCTYLCTCTVHVHVHMYISMYMYSTCTVHTVHCTCT